MLQDASQGPAAGQVSQGPRTAGNQEGVVPGTWRETTAQSVTDSEVASWDQALHGHQPSSSLLLPATVSQGLCHLPPRGLGLPRLTNHLCVPANSLPQTELENSGHRTQDWTRPRMATVLRDKPLDAPGTE